MWSPALLALLIAGLLMALSSERFAGWAAGLAEARAGAYLGREVEIGSLSIELVPLSVEAVDVVIAGAGGADSDGAAESSEGDAFAEIERVVIDARVGSVLRPGITLHRLFVDRPTIRVAFDEEGRHDAPRPVRRRPRSEPRRFDVAIGSVEVVGGVFEMEHRRYPLDVSARDFVANLAGDAADGVELAGQLRADDVTVVLPGANPYLGAVSLRGKYQRGSVEIADGTFDAPDLAARVSGSLHWRDDPRVELSVVASGQGRLLDRLGYGDGLIEGPFAFEGEFARREQDWSLAGRLTSPAVEVVERGLTAVRGRLQVDREGARFLVQEAGYGGGSLSGTVRLAAGSGEAPVELDLRLERVDVERLLSDQRIPISGLAATAGGSFSYQFARSEPRSGNGWVDLRITRDAEPEPDGLAVDGSAVMSFGDGRLRTEAVRLRGDNQLVVAVGAYDMATGRGSFEIDVTTEAVEEVLALLPIDDPRAIWRPERGRGTASAELTLEGDAVTIVTAMDLEDVAAPGYRAERLQGRFALDAVGLRDLRIELHRPAAALIVAGSVPLAAEEVPGDRGLSLAVDAEGWPVSDFAPWLPFDLPLDGPFSGGATILGSLEAPSGSASGGVTSPRLGDTAASRLDFDLDFSPERVSFHRLEAAIGRGLIRAVGTYDVPGDEIDLAVESERLPIADLGVLPVPSERLGGTLAVAGSIGGSSVAPRASMLVDFESVSVDGASLGSTGSGRLRLEWTGSRLDADGEIEGLLRVRGGGLLEEGAADLSFEVASSDLRSILMLLAPDGLPDFEAGGAGELILAGAVGPGGLPGIELRMDELLVRHQGAAGIGALENLEPVRLRLERGVLNLASFYLGTPGGGSEFFVTGDIDLGQGSVLDLNVQSSLDTAWLEPWVPEGVELAEGTFDVIGSVLGTLGEPRLDGVGRFARGKVITTGFPATFEATEAVFLFFPGEVILDQLSAKVAGGRLEAAGVVDLQAAEQLEYRFQISGDGLNFRYPEGWSIRGDADLTIASIPDGRQLTGSLALDRALYVTDVPIELDQLLRSYFEQRRLEVEETDELLASTQLNVAVEAKDTLRVRNNLANLRGSADLVLRGSLATPVVFGTVEFDPSGRLTYSGNEYELERGLLTFANPYRLEPVIDLVAHTGLREYDVTLSLSGTPERLNFDFISDPPLAELDVMALMTGGRPRGPRFEATRPAPGLEGDDLGAETFLYGQATSLVASRFNRLFGLDQFRIVPLTSATGDLSSARITVGKRLSRDLFATYSYDPSETAEQIFEVEWSVSRSLVLVVTQNGDGTYAVDAKYEKAF